MLNNEDFLSRFDNAAATALAEWQEDRIQNEDAASITPDEAYEAALADLRALLFEYTYTG